MSNISGYLYCDSFSCGSFTPPASSVLNASIVANAKVAASKVQQRWQPVFSQNGTSSTERRVVHYVKGATGVLNSFICGSRVACVGAATIVVDLLKNGTTMLSSTVTLNSSNTAYVAVSATLASSALVVGDVLEVSITSTAGGGTLGSGFYALPQIDEDAN